MNYWTTKALNSLAPDAVWSMDAEDYDKLTWLSIDIPKPTKEEVTQEVARLQAEYDAKEYQRQRVPEYPSIGDQLDAIWKGGDAYDAMLAKVMAIKDKYPKPE
jgi:hypothetical protein